MNNLSASKSHGKIDILYQDRQIVVINKPAGLLSVPFSLGRGRTALSILEEKLQSKGRANSKYHPYAVHRLDRDTSGIMMFALTESARKKIMDTWHKMVTLRQYRALCEKNPKMNIINFHLQDCGLIDAPIAKNAYNVGFVPKADSRAKNGRPFLTESARTFYKVIEEGKKYVLFELTLDTGKKNQIRAHLSAAGFPVLGDQSHRAKENPFGRLCLHALSLEFTHPFTSEQLKFKIDEPEAWRKICKDTYIS